MLLNKNITKNRIYISSLKWVWTLYMCVCHKLIKIYSCLSSLYISVEDKHLLFAVKNRAAGVVNAGKATDQRQRLEPFERNIITNNWLCWRPFLFWQDEWSWQLFQKHLGFCEGLWDTAVGFNLYFCQNEATHHYLPQDFTKSPKYLITLFAPSVCASDIWVQAKNIYFKALKQSRCE